MPSLRIIYDLEGWAYANRARALQRYAPADFEVSVAPLLQPDGSADLAKAIGDAPMDLLFVLYNGPGRPRAIHAAVHERGWNPKLIGCWNAGWPLDLPDFPARYQEADLLIVNNRETWERLGCLPRTALCPNGVDLEIFRVHRAVASRPHRVLWLGSEYWRSVKGYDDILLPVQERLTSAGIPSDFRLVDSHRSEKRSPGEMADWYNTGTVFVCASQAEGTPNTALEAAACGCVVVSTRVGNMPELIRSGENGYLVERNVDSVLAAVRAAIDGYLRLAIQLQSDIQAWSWQGRAAAIFDVLRGG